MKNKNKTVINKKFDMPHFLSAFFNFCATLALSFSFGVYAIKYFVMTLVFIKDSSISFIVSIIVSLVCTVLFILSVRLFAYSLKVSK